MHSIQTFKMMREFNLMNNNYNLQKKNKILFKILSNLRVENSELKRQNFLLLNDKEHPYYKVIDTYIEKFKIYDDNLNNNYPKLAINETYYDWNTTRIYLQEIADKLHEFHIQFCLIPFSNNIKQIELVLNKNNMIGNRNYMSFLFFTIDSFNKSLDNGWLKLYYTDSYNEKELIFIKNIISKSMKVNKKDGIISIQILKF